MMLTEYIVPWSVAKELSNVMVTNFVDEIFIIRAKDGLHIFPYCNCFTNMGSQSATICETWVPTRKKGKKRGGGGMNVGEC